ncbi:MAG TPA: DUF4919 domain-containing protein [Pyrinomonadaceae bacterium]|nr:DUF4919 domain-containing protein [Pyrinomonadaceae bacterium]HMP65653.1 DUF4919 domain-containing protein [Pyrinomonadaceae bacterium]
MRRLIFPIFFLGVFCLSGAAQTPKNADPAATPKVTIDSKFTANDYELMLKKVKSGDMSVSFAALRMAYTETKDYSPYGGAQQRNEMMKALHERRYAEARSSAERFLATNFVDLTAQFVMWKANEGLERWEEAEFHQKIFSALIDAIFENDGLSEETAILSIGISEQYFVMNYLGFVREMKALVRNETSIFDVHTARNPDTNESRRFFFNINKVFGRLF